MTGISLNHLPHHTYAPCSLMRYVVYFPKLPVEKKTFLLISQRNKCFFLYKWKALENFTVPFGGKFSPVFPYKWKALKGFSEFSARQVPAQLENSGIRSTLFPGIFPIYKEKALGGSERESMQSERASVGPNLKCPLFLRVFYAPLHPDYLPLLCGPIG